MSVTSDMRAAWAPPCTGPFARMHLNGAGVVSVRSATVPAWMAFDAILRRHNYTTRRADTGAYNCRKITGGSNYSLHAYGIAVDINWQSNPYGRNLITDMSPAMIADIEGIHTNTGHRVFRWGGRYTNNKDAMHFEVICTPAQLSTGIRGLPQPARPSIPAKPAPSVPSPPTAPSVTPNPTGVDMYIAVVGVGFFAQVGDVTIPLPGISLGDFGALQKAASCPTQIIPASAAADFAAKTMLQTKRATGG